jgi:hypothetical protein
MMILARREIEGTGSGGRIATMGSWVADSTDEGATYRPGPRFPRGDRRCQDVRVTDLLQDTLVEIERHVAGAGWDQPPQLFALARTSDLVETEPEFAAALGLAGDLPTGALTPVEQDPLPGGPLDESLAKIGWPDEVAGCALVQEVVVLPPDVEAALPQHAGVLDWVAEHPERREARLAVAVLRDGSRACAVRLRAAGADEDALLVGEDLVPNLAEALLATLD